MPVKSLEPTPTVLLVDGDEMQSLSSKRELESQGYRVVCAYSGEDAFAAFEQEKIDAVVADALLPDMHVLDLIYGLAAKRRRIPIVVNSPYTVCNHNFRYWAADAIVDKSSDTHKLFAQVAALL